MLITILIVIGVIVYLHTNKKNINFKEIFQTVKTTEVKQVDNIESTFDEISGLKEKLNVPKLGGSS